MNSAGDYVAAGYGIDGGDTGLLPNDIYYCGRMKNQCRCGSCDGMCGPIDGCPCSSCFLFTITRRNEIEEASSNESVVATSTVVAPSAPPLLPDVLDTSKSSTDSQIESAQNNVLDECSICLTNQIDSTIVHGETGHMCCCYKCAVDLKKAKSNCPICRQSIDAVIKTYRT
jgi:E3 ubiquitin-protein ligase Mdm2